MDTREMTGIRRSYEVVDFGEENLRRQLEVVFGRVHRPLYYAETASGVLASNSLDAVSLRDDGPRIPTQDLDSHACESIGCGFAAFLGRLDMHERLVMAGGWPDDQSDFPYLDGWRLKVTCPKVGITLAQITPAWWS